MKKDNETVEQLLNCLRKEDDANMIPFHCEGIEAAYKRKMLENRFKLDNNKDEINGLRGLIKELADALDESNKTECEYRCKCSCKNGGEINGCLTMCHNRALVKKAREVCK